MAASLPSVLKLPPVTQLSPRVLRVLGFNPGPFTLGGSNTYVVGTGKERLLIDTGEGKPEYIDALRQESQKNGFDITKVLITHHHHDHVGGIPDVAGAWPNATVHKYPSRFADGEMVESLREKGYTKPLDKVDLSDQYSVDGATLKVVPSPGHTDDHVIFWLEEEKALFTADTILGYGTSVFAHYGDYMSTLKRLQDMNPEVIYPGHAACTEVGGASAVIAQYLAHRLARQNQLLLVLHGERNAEAIAAAKRPAAPELPALTTAAPPITLAEIVALVYADTPEHLHPAAAGNMLQYLRTMREEGSVNVLLEGPKSEIVNDVLGESEYLSAGEGKAVNVERMEAMFTSTWSLSATAKGKL